MIEEKSSEVKPIQNEEINPVVMMQTRRAEFNYPNYPCNERELHLF